jgi:hypothetical protein
MVLVCGLTESHVVHDIYAAILLVGENVCLELDFIFATLLSKRSRHSSVQKKTQKVSLSIIYH